MYRDSGLDPLHTPDSVLQAYQTGRGIMDSVYSGSKCSIVIEDEGSNWRIVVSRISDGESTFELIPK